jgi:hypothetical protein
MVNYSPQIKNNNQPLCRFAVIHINFQQLFAKGKSKSSPLMFAIRQPASRAVNFFLLALQATLASVGLANNVDAYRFWGFRQTTDTESGIETEVISNA